MMKASAAARSERGSVAGSLPGILAGRCPGRSIPRDIVIVMATIGLIGAGNIGAQVARVAVAHGHDVVISNSRGPETLTALVTELGPKARAASVVDAAKAGE